MRIRLMIAFVLVIGLSMVPVFRKVLAGARPIVTVTVQATDPGGFTLKYRWKSTDGTIANVNAATTSWVLPNGPGIHFAYVLVSNDHGGYTERRVAVNTDSIGTPPVIPPPLPLSAPKSAPQVGDFYRAWVNNGGSYEDKPVTTSPRVAAYVPNSRVFVTDTITGKRFPATGNIISDLKGQYVVPNLPAGKSFLTSCSFDGGKTFVDCTASINQPNPFIMPPVPETAWTDYNLIYSRVDGSQSYNGNLVLNDGNPCGTVNEFFDVHSTGRTMLKNSAGATLVTVPIAVNGVWSLPLDSEGASIVLNCESAPPITMQVFPAQHDYRQSVITSVSAPVVSNITAMFNGASVGAFLPPPTGFPSDTLPLSDAFLAEKGLDSRLSACRYYQTTGAVQACTPGGVFTRAISFEDWKRTVKIDGYASAPVYTATYINKADLNLTRDHHSVSYGPNQTAAYVCNYLGYRFDSLDEFLVPTQEEVDTAVGDAVAGRNLVACVAMDWSITAGVNGGKPFTRFLIFGPSGELLPSVNLDGRREKYVPGTCVVCHGGDHYAGQFPSDATGKANIGAHFLPYDIGNFLFSSSAGLTRASQEVAIYNLNQNVLKTGPTAGEAELINGWYANGQIQNLNYLPASWAISLPKQKNFYRKVYAHTCRGCHIAMIKPFNWEDYSQLGNLEPATVCFGAGFGWMGHSMPNSLVTMNRFWLSAGNTVGLPDQVAIFSLYPGLPGGNSCKLEP